MTDDSEIPQVVKTAIYYAVGVLLITVIIALVVMIIIGIRAFYNYGMGM